MIPHTLHTLHIHLILNVAPEAVTTIFIVKMVKIRHSLLGDQVLSRHITEETEFKPR